MPAFGTPPAVSLPKGGGAIHGIGEKFSANAVTGTGSFSVPIATSRGRSGFGPMLTLTYDSGRGNGPFGFGWSLSLPAITRKTDKGLPRYRDGEESDVFILSDAEDLVPVLDSDQGWASLRFDHPAHAPGWRINQYRPRVEGPFARIERWTRIVEPQSPAEPDLGDAHWRSISRDNVTTLYGIDANSRIADPKDPRRIFSWLICHSWDDKGNAIVYEYKPEDSTGVDTAQAHERNRTPSGRSAGRYLKRIRYGNHPSRLVESDLGRMQWLFEVVFDYGEHDPAVPRPADAGSWLCRRDPFSSYRAGFEVRTYRLCQRVLMFHHFPDEPDVGAECLVRSTDFSYRSLAGRGEERQRGEALGAFLASVTQSGYRRHGDGYRKSSLPPVELGYSLAEFHTEVEDVDPESLDNLPAGLAGAGFQWVDLDGEGIAGILTEQGGGWFYKSNLGRGTFGHLERLPRLPSLASLGGGRQQLLDLAGDGSLDLVDLAGPAPGFFERTDRGWSNFATFRSLPNLGWGDPNLRFVDLDGDGHADVLVTGQEALTWYPSLAEDGFASGERVPTPVDEESGPRLVFADGTQSIYLADMSGDGMADLVRIRNGEVCYWPNLGYGCFGAKVTMDDAPWFATPDAFDQRLLRLTDVDGSGVTDIIYLGGETPAIYLNESGNRWAPPQLLRAFPAIDDRAAVATVDLLGTGTACLVWSSALPSDARRSMRYVDLMGRRKPHLLVSMANNLGAETHVSYASSTRFYLADKWAGRPWATRLPFPVHVVERVEVVDRVSCNRFSSRYAYHHGYFDGAEREFRGFGLVEQWDTEELAVLSASDTLPDAANIDEASHVPPVLTKTWFHTGAHLVGGRISRQYETEYWREGDASGGLGGLTDDEREAMLLDDSVPPDTILLPDGSHRAHFPSPDEAEEASRALRGSILRQEIYALDGTDASDRPYRVTEHNYSVELLQPKGPNRHAVCFQHSREAVTFDYERCLYDIALSDGSRRRLADPRVIHELTLETDAFGNILRSAAVAYPRRHHPTPDAGLALEVAEELPRQQGRIYVTLTVNRYTSAISGPENHRAPLPSETITSEVLNVAPSASVPLVTNLFRFVELEAKTRAASNGHHDLPYEDIDGAGAAAGEPCRRPIEHVRTLYRSDNLAAPLPLGRAEARGLVFAVYKLAFTPGLLAGIYIRAAESGIAENLLPDPGAVLGTDGGYVSSATEKGLGLFPAADLDDWWWIPTGRVFHSPDMRHTPHQELQYAREHFFVSARFRDPFGQWTIVAYDRYDLLVEEAEDALGNQTTVGARSPAGARVAHGNDYRVLKPRLVMDANRNGAAVTYDILGQVVGTAVMGKPEHREGDSLDGFESDLAVDVLLAHIQSPLTDPHAILGQATTRLVYDLFVYQRTRGDPRPQPTVVYTIVRETHATDLAENEQTALQHAFSYSDGFGREIQRKVQAEPGPLVEGGPDVRPRWVGNGWSVFNNKGKPVRQYEPFFSATHAFEFARVAGVSQVLFYDPPERLVATLHPNATYDKVVFDPWRQASWDGNDTVLFDPRTDEDVAGFAGTYLATLGRGWETWHDRRRAGALGPEEQRAAEKAAVHAGTPMVTHLDTLGRAFLTIAHNQMQLRDTPPAEGRLATRLRFDIEGNPRAVIDAMRRLVMRFDYDMAGNRIRQASMDTGERWMLSDVAHNPIRFWDSRRHALRITYDAVRRPTETFLTDREDLRPRRPARFPPREGREEILVGRTVYGEGEPEAETRNLRTRPYQVFDGAGVVTHAYDFKGNLAESTRELAQEYVTTLDWGGPAPLLEPEHYTTTNTYDALNRPATVTTPDRTIVRRRYNEAGLLERIEANLGGAEETTAFVTDVDYDAKGQRTGIEYGMLDEESRPRVQTFYRYDPETFRLASLRTIRRGFPADQSFLQDLSYSYDPVGNIVEIRDDAQQVIFFRNQRVEPAILYVYDALYRLVEATGREHLGQALDGRLMPLPTSSSDTGRVGLDHPGDRNLMGIYQERYIYDDVGNLMELRHRGTDIQHPGWTRSYGYTEPSLLEPGKVNDRLSVTQLSGDPERPYTYDRHGNAASMPHLSFLQWDYADRLQASATQDTRHMPETTYYVYDSAGERVRKVTEGALSEAEAAAGRVPTRKDERIYLGGFEVYREYDGARMTVSIERQTCHVMQDRQRVALVEVRTVGSDGSARQLIRYQLTNHLGSASAELDQNARVISYEEYFPYGSTCYSAFDRRVIRAKRYRYTGKERDEESGFLYHGARYYAPWLGRWTSCDPARLEPPAQPSVLLVAAFSSPYAAFRSNPISYIDPDGRNSRNWREILLRAIFALNAGAQAQNYRGIEDAHPTREPVEGSRESEIEREAERMQRESQERNNRPPPRGPSPDDPVDPHRPPPNRIDPRDAVREVRTRELEHVRRADRRRAIGPEWGRASGRGRPSLPGPGGVADPRLRDRRPGSSRILRSEGSGPTPTVTVIPAVQFGLRIMIFPAHQPPSPSIETVPAHRPETEVHYSQSVTADPVAGVRVEAALDPTPPPRPTPYVAPPHSTPPSEPGDGYQVHLYILGAAALFAVGWAAGPAILGGGAAAAETLAPLAPLIPVVARIVRR